MTHADSKPPVATLNRILILGPGGAGKSTLARKLAERLDLPLIHLDQHYWQPGWVPMDADKWPDVVADLTARDRWVMDGNFGGTLHLRLPRADLVVFLDVNRWQSLWGAFTRVLKQSGQVRSDMAAGCPERFDPEFFIWLWNFPRDSKPELEAAFARHPQTQVVRLRSRNAVGKWLGALSACPKRFQDGSMDT